MLALYSAPVRPPLECCVQLSSTERDGITEESPATGSKMIEGLSCDSWDCSAQRMPKGSLIHVYECLKAGCKIKNWFSHLSCLPSGHTRQTILIQTQL